MKYELGKVCSRLSSGKGIPASQISDSGEYPVYGGNGLRGYTDHANFEGECAIIGRQGAFCGNVRFFSGKAYMTEHAVVVCANEQSSTRYLAYLLSIMNLGRLSGQSAQPGLSVKTLAKQEIELPALEQQNKIVSILASLDDKIEQNQKLNDNLEQQAMVLYGKSFPYAVADELPAGWRVGTVGEIIEIHDSKRIPLSGAQRAKMEKRIYPYYGAASLMDYVDEYIFDGKYLLLGEDGTVVNDAGYPVLQYVWGQFWVNNHAHILTGKLGFNVESLFLLFKHTPVKSIVTGAVQPKISQANLRSIQVVIPPRSELDAFNELICPLFGQIRQNQDQNKLLATLRDTLLPKLMSGEIDVSAIQL
jgi:type I restriction enzyme S subunit